MTSHFQNSWLEDPRFRGWIKKKDDTTAYCTYCFYKPIDLNAMGASALVSHARGKKHRERCPVQPVEAASASKQTHTPVKSSKT